VSLISAAPTTPAGEILTRTQILRRFLRETGIGQSGTATGGSTTTIVDTGRLQSTQYNSDDWVGGWARIAYDSGGAAAAPETEMRPITTYAPSTGTITVNPAFSAAPASGDTYQLWRNPHPQEVLDALDAILTKETWLLSTGILTMCPDGDMEQSHTTDWTGTNATVTKVTTAPAFMGKRWLSVVTTAAGGYAESATMRVEPGRKIHASVLARVTAASTTAEFTVYDKTNSAVIGTTVTSTRQHVARLWQEVTIPTTCNQIALRLGNTENTVTSIWDEACVYALDASEINLPWWVGDQSQVKGIFRLRSPLSLGTGIWDATYRGETDRRWDLRPNDLGIGAHKLVARYAQGLSMPLYIVGTRPEETYANDNTETKHLDGNWIQAALAFRIFDSLASYPNAGALDMGWLEKQRAKWQDEYEKRKYQQAVRLEALRRAPAPDALYYRESNDWANESWVVR